MHRHWCSIYHWPIVNASCMLTFPHTHALQPLNFRNFKHFHLAIMQESIEKVFCFFFHGKSEQSLDNWSESYWTDRIGWVGTPSDRSHQYHRIFDDNFLIPESFITFSTFSNGAIWLQSMFFFVAVETTTFALKRSHSCTYIHTNEWKINFQLKKHSHFHFGLPFFSHQFQWTLHTKNVKQNVNLVTRQRQNERH